MDTYARVHMPDVLLVYLALAQAEDLLFVHFSVRVEFGATVVLHIRLCLFLALLCFVVSDSSSALAARLSRNQSR